MRLTSALLVLLAATAAPTASAQRARPGVDRSERPLLEQRFRERLSAIMQQRLGLTDDQATRLTDVNQRFEERRTAIVREELATRRDLREALAPGATPDQQRVAGLLDRTIQTNRQRLALIEEEQAELAVFLTPVQRARYFGLQEQLRLQIEEMRDRRPGAPRGPVRRPPGPPF